MVPSFSLGLGSLELSGELKILEGSSPVAFQDGGWLEGGGVGKKKVFDKTVSHFFFPTPPPPATTSRCTMEHSNTFLSHGGIHWDMPISLNIMIARFVAQIVLYRII